MRAADRLPLCTFSVISTTIKSTPLSANTGRSIIPTILRLESPVHKTFTRVVTRQFDAHNIDTFFQSLCIYIYIIFRRLRSLRSFRGERRNFVFPFLLPSDRKRNGRSYRSRDHTMYVLQVYLSQSRRSYTRKKEDLFVVLLQRGCIVVSSSTVEISNRVESLSPQGDFRHALLSRRCTAPDPSTEYIFQRILARLSDHGI